jgi:cytochrome c553
MYVIHQRIDVTIKESYYDCCKEDKHLKRKVVILIVLMITISFLYMNAAYAGVFLDSAHGNSTYGVDRNAAGFPSDYPDGHCDHCHEQHASIGGSQPAPVGSGPSNYMLFEDNYVSQTDGICFECHKDAGSYQTGGSIVNRSYSYRAGGWTADTVNDILESFSFSSPDSSHYLDNIQTEMTEQNWGYTANSNPCNACHNPHAAQGDPANAPNTAKTSGTRGYPVSRPSQHSTDNNSWGLWGDGAGEKMSDYTTFYQAPYRFNSTSTYEPDGAAVADATKLTDYVTLCTDCHNNSNTITSTPLGRNLHYINNKQFTFNWNNEKHGGGTANDACADIFDPYFTDGNCGNYVLSCTDCHEPHGSPNIFLIRKVVNGGVVTVDTGTGNGPGWLPCTPSNTSWSRGLCISSMSL